MTVTVKKTRVVVARQKSGILAMTTSQPKKVVENQQQPPTALIMTHLLIANPILGTTKPPSGVKIIAKRAAAVAAHVLTPTKIAALNRVVARTAMTMRAARTVTANAAIAINALLTSRRTSIDNIATRTDHAPTRTIQTVRMNAIKQSVITEPHHHRCQLLKLVQRIQ